MKHCIVTMEIAGPTKNGGIGTHCYYLAKFLRKTLGHDVTVLLGSPPLKDNGSAYWKSYFRDKIDIEFEHVNDYPAFSNLPGPGHFHYAHEWTLNIYARLKDCSYDICHFQDNNANAFVSTMAKKAGLHFRNTLFTCTLHSPDQWIRQANRQYSHAGGKDMHMDFMERKGAEMCDYIVAPVNYMLEYVKSLEWDIQNKARVIPYLIDDIEKAPERDFNKKHLIFFGRLETRKGLEIFVDALASLTERIEYREKKLRVTFLGKPNSAYGRDALDYLKILQTKLPASHVWEFKTDLDHFQATSYLRNHSDALVVIPSPVDNSPFTVIESLEMGLNVIAADSGGIPELFGGPERLFPPTVEGLRRKLEEAFTGRLPGLPSNRYSKEKAETGWRQFIKMLEEKSELQKKSSKPSIKQKPSAPKTCLVLTRSMDNGNIERALDSLKNQTRQDFQLVVLTEGLSDTEVNFLHKSYERDGWKFEQHNKDKKYITDGHGRNFDLSQIKSDYLIFMEDNCLAEPDMVETLENSIVCLKTDAASCYYRNRTENGKFSDKIWESRYFYGASRELGLLNNCFAESVFIIRRDAYQSLGGFTNDRANITPEWEFFIRFTLAGYQLGVIPKFLFLKRLQPHSGTSANHYNYYYSHMKSVEPLIKNLCDWEKNIAVSLVGVDQLNENLNTRLYFLKKSEVMVNPENYIDRELSKLQNNYYHLLKFPLLYKRYKRKLSNFLLNR